MITYKLQTKNLIKPPPWLPSSIIYETQMGSHAYGTQTKDSDQDIYGICIPPKNYTFPHTDGYIWEFDKNIPKFEQYLAQDIVLKEPLQDFKYDISVYNIVRFFRLALENNPNIIDSLFTPSICIIHTSPIGQLIKENRHKFLHKGAYHKFKGFAYSQLAKLKNKDKEGTRRVEIEKYGYSVKFAYHIVRLVLECEQILMTGDLDLQKYAALLKEIRVGGWKEEDIYKWFEDKDKVLEELYNNSKIPYAPDEKVIKELLLNCLEMWYGSLKGCVINEEKILKTLKEVTEILMRLQDGI